MGIATTLTVIFVFFSALLVGLIALRPAITATRGGKILAFLILFLLPILCLAMGTTRELERSTSTQFCLSCHVMVPYGKSLRVDDPTYLAAAHFQNHRVPADQACYTCHSDYAMFGGVRAKLRGLRHVFIYYFTKPPAPENIRLYTPFNNRECLHCHLGARSFEEGAVHNADPDLLPAVKANKISCISSGCHEVVHNVRNLPNLKFWKGGQ